jgi:hypothetical protein
MYYCTAWYTIIQIAGTKTQGYTLGVKAICASFAPHERAPPRHHFRAGNCPMVIMEKMSFVTYRLSL